jgi:DedD protein
MEKKNILLVIGSVTLFLVVVLAAGLWLFWPESQGKGRTASVSVKQPGSEGFDTFEYYRGRQDLPGLADPKATPPKDGPLTLSIGETAPQTPPVSVQPRPAAAQQQAAPASPGTVTTPTAPGSATVAARPASAAPPRATTPRLTRVSEYWIQAGSYKSRVGAEGLNKKLAEAGLPGTITTRDVSGETYFRVRIGPYKSQSEADKFLGTVRGLDGLASSFISVVPRTTTN